MKKTKFLLLAAVLILCSLVCCGCGKELAGTPDDTGETASDDTFVLSPRWHGDYVHFVTLSDETMIKVFSSFNELETFVEEGGLVNHVFTSSTHSLEKLLNFFGEESFEENVVVLFIAQTGDMRYKGSVAQIKGNSDKIEGVIEYDLDHIFKNGEEEYAMSIAMKIPKEYCNKDTQFNFAFSEREAA